MNGPRTRTNASAPVCRTLGWLAAIGMGVSVIASAHGAKVDWNIPADPAAQRRLCADYPPEPSAGDISDFWDSPARRRIVACETLMEVGNPDPDLYYYAGRLWLDIAFPDRARDMFRRGAEAGSTKAMLALGYWHWEQRDDPETMLKHYKMAAERGDPVAQTVLGIIYRGLNSSFRDSKYWDFERGLKLLRAAAEQGYPIAHYALGMTIWPDDESDQQAVEEAVSHVRAAARGGVPHARQTLRREGYEAPEPEDGMNYPTLWSRPLILDRP